jgi:acyl carrier protein
MEHKLREIFAVVLDLPKESVVPELSPDTCASWDSLQHIHLVCAIDESFGIELSVEQQIEMMTFDLTLDVVREATSSGVSYVP